MSLKRTLFEIFAFKNFPDLETGVWGHSRSSKMVPVDRAYATSCSRSVVTVALYRPVSEIWCDNVAKTDSLKVRKAVIGLVTLTP